MFTFQDSFEAPAGTNTVALHKQITIDQHASRVERCANLVKADKEKDELSAPTVKALKDTLMKHYSAGAVRWLACHANTPSCRSASARKEALVDELAKARVLPPLISDLQNAIAVWKRRTAAIGNDEEEGDEGDERDQSDDSGDEAEKIAPTAPVEAMAEAADAMRGLAKELRLSRAKDERQRSNDSDDDLSDDDGVTKTQYTRHLAKQIKKMVKHAFVDPMDFSPKRIEKLKFAVAGARRSTNIGGGVKITVRDDALSDISSAGGWYDPVQMREGFSLMLETMLDVPEAKYRVKDLMAFGREVWDFPGATSQGKAVYLKQMLFKYQASDNLIRDMHQDTVLERKYLLGPNSPGLVTLNARSGHNGQQQFRSQAGAGGAYRANAARREGGRKRSAPSGSTKVCWTRLEKGKGECRYGTNCRFSHTCASCGGNHSADKCGNWNAVKAKSAADTQRSSLRRRT